MSVQGQRYTANGDPVGGQFLVNSYTSSWQTYPAVGMDATGDFVVVWQSYGSDNGDTLEESIQGQRFRPLAIFADGFESGSTAAWSATVGASP